MKDLKYLKLFEAFESIKLGKTLNFINTGAKSIFIDNLKEIASNYDFPISKFNDDMFEYLPFKSALMKNVDPPKPTEKEVCKRESDWIPGEFCQGGRVKRTWGNHTRMVECPGCGGTGFKPLKKITPDVSLVKFWFDKDGNFVNVTGCDGVIRPQNKTTDSTKSENLYEFSKNLEDYNQIRQISVSELLKLPTGSIVLFRPQNERISAVSMVFHGRRSNDREAAYMLQNQFSGTSPSEDGLISFDELIKYADYSWCVTGSGDFGSATLLEAKKREVKPKREIKPLVEEEAYNWNNIINLGSMYMSNYKDMEEKLKNAHFAIILDLNKLKESEFQKVSNIKYDRELRKSGAFLKPEQVKNVNLERYLNLLIKKFDANKGLSELNKVMPRAFGYTNALTFILREYNMRNMEVLIDKLFIFMQNPTNNQDSIMSSLETIYRNSQDRNMTINRASDEVWRVLDNRNNEKEKKYFQTYQEISYLIYEKVLAEKIETLGDIEILINKIKSLKYLIADTRYDSIRRCVRNIGEYLGTGYTNYVVNYIENAIENYPNAQSEIEEFKRMIEKTF